ncbi:acylphosphatase [Pedobacter alpinus]|uniref:acylphosphatase n=1 Tax=Pedobacter alpinus TaxID=1590643 RepID=A0ABW5TPK6_9SPHI
MKTLEITVTGRVQRVFFRASTKAVADQMGIKGFAKNQTDGSVLIHAEGEEMFLEDFIDWCKYGPDDARVDDIKIEEIEMKNYRNFDVLKK